MGKSSPSPPPAPDYARLAAAQGAANLEAARATAKLSNPNIVGPLGGQRVTYGTVDEDAYQRALAAYNASSASQPTYDWETGATTPAAAAPTRAQFTADADTPTITQYLTPESQATLEAQQRVQRALAGLGEQGIATAQRIMGTPFQYQGPAIQTSLGGYGQVQNAPDLEAYGRAGANVAAGPVNVGPAVGQYGMAQAGPTGPQLQGRLDTSRLAAMPVAAGTTAQQAIMSRLQPQLERQRSQLETQLANQGLVRGGEAYTTAVQEQAQRENDLLTQAALQGINVDLAARQQGLAEQQSLGGFANQAALQQFGAGQAANQAYNQAVQQNMAMGMSAAQAQNAAAQQLYSQQMGIQGLYNAAIGQNQQTALAQMQAQNAAQNQAYNQALQAAQFGNTAQQQALQQQLGLYNQPLNQISALMSGSQLQMPQFQGYQGANVGASPVFQAGQLQNQYAIDVYNQQQAARNQQMGGLFGLTAAVAPYAIEAAPAFMAAFSDRRLKSNIVKIADDPRGFGIYEYDIFGRRERGVMAQEIEKIIPSAVIEHPSGFKMVNYGAL